MITIPLVHRTTAVLKIPARKAAVTASAASIVNAMTNNPAFPSPTPPLATISADLAAYEAAEAAVVTRVKGAAVTRNAKYAVLHADLQHLMAYVQQVADANPANAQSMIESARFSIRKTASRLKSAIKIEPGQLSGVGTKETRSGTQRLVEAYGDRWRLREDRSESLHDPEQSIREAHEVIAAPRRSRCVPPGFSRVPSGPRGRARAVLPRPTRDRIEHGASGRGPVGVVRYNQGLLRPAPLLLRRHGGTARLLLWGLSAPISSVIVARRTSIHPSGAGCAYQARSRSLSIIITTLASTALCLRLRYGRRLGARRARREDRHVRRWRIGRDGDE